MNITLLISGEQVDFASTMKTLFKEALQEMQFNTTDTPSPEFDIKPTLTYPVTDERVLKLFGVTGLKNPSQSIINALRAQGIDPIKRGRLGSIVYGSQILTYLDKLQHKQVDFTLKN